MGDETQERETELANVQEQIELPEQQQKQVHGCEQPCGGHPEAVVWMAALNSCPQSELHSDVLVRSLDSCNAEENEPPTAELPTEEVPSSEEFPELMPMAAQSSMLEHEAVDPLQSHDRLLAVSATGEVGAEAAAAAAAEAAVEALLDSCLLEFSERSSCPNDLNEQGSQGPEMCHGHDRSLAADSTGTYDVAAAAAAAAADAMAEAAGPQMHEEQE